MNAQKIDWLKLGTSGNKNLVMVPRDWWAWVLHCKGFTPEQITKELFVPPSYLKRVFSHAREHWITYFDAYDHCTWN